MRLAIAFSLASASALLFLAVEIESAPADGGGIFTPPLQTPVSINSYFDHHGPPSRTSLPFTRWDGFSDPTTNSYCMQNPDGTFFCPCSSTTGNCYNGHEGVDFSTGGVKLPVYAAARGTVDGQPAFEGSFGNTVRLSHANVGLNTRYHHLDIWSVNNGQFVQRGQLIGYAGNSGVSTGIHLHFGVYNAPSGGTFVDPNGWAFTNYASTDPWPADIGHLWGTRLGVFSSSSIGAKEGQLNAGWESNLTLPGSGSVTAMSLEGSRIGIVRGGTAYAKDASLNVGQPNGGWQTIATNALDIKLSGARLGVLTSSKVLAMKGRRAEQRLV